MELREAAQEIRDTVSMDTILALYGYQPRHGVMVCPFHGDHDASLKVYKGTRGWHCFGCGRGGSVIDFVMEHDGCNFQTAVKAIDLALNMDLLKAEDPFDVERRQRQAAILDKMAALLTEEIDFDERRINFRIGLIFPRYRELDAIPRRERTAREWTEMENLREALLYEEYLKEKCEKQREEVKTWRREKRRGDKKAR